MVSALEYKQGPNNSKSSRIAKGVWLIRAELVRKTIPEEGLESDLNMGTWRAFQEGKIGSKFTDVNKETWFFGKPTSS